MAFVAAHNILSPLGFTSSSTFEAVAAGKSAVAEYAGIFPGDAAVWASKLPESWLPAVCESLGGAFTKFEALLLTSVKDALARTNVDVASPRTVLIFATTKGNIGLIEDGQPVNEAMLQRLNLFASAQRVAQYFGNATQPVVVSNACTSGVAALLYAQRLLKSGQYDTAVVTGADTVGKFVLSGFQAFHALSAGACKPFSEDRDGINLGEAAATIVLTVAPVSGEAIELAGGALSNDANHISGPSRTGAELAAAIAGALRGADVTPESVDFISAHGTATSFNDAMEAKAFKLAGVRAKPVHSIKGALGHTLGAAGLVESVLSVLSLAHGCLLPTAGHSEPMLTDGLNVTTTSRHAPLRVALKTASGFGGCNGALVFKRN